MEKNIKRIIQFPKNISFIFFVIHFGFLVGFHGITSSEYYISLIDLIIDIVILVLFQSISLFIALSESTNNYAFYKFSVFFSVIITLAILFSILIYILCLLLDKNYDIILKCKCNKKKELGYFLIALKFIELLPSLSIFIIVKKIKRSPGTIDMAFKDFNIIKRTNTDNTQ